MSDSTDRSATALLGDLIKQVTELFRKEIHLLRAEVSEKSNQAVTAGGLIIAAVVISLTALNVLATAVVVALANMGLGAGWSALVVGAVLGAIAYGLASKGVDDLKATNLAPRRTTDALARDAEMTKEKVT